MIKQRSIYTTCHSHVRVCPQCQTHHTFLKNTEKPLPSQFGSGIWTWLNRTYRWCNEETFQSWIDRIFKNSMWTSPFTNVKAEPACHSEFHFWKHQKSPAAALQVTCLMPRLEAGYMSTHRKHLPVVLTLNTVHSLYTRFTPQTRLILFDIHSLNCACPLYVLHLVLVSFTRAVTSPALFMNHSHLSSLTSQIALIHVDFIL